MSPTNSRRSTQTSFPLLESCSCENFGLARFSIVWSESRQLIKTGALFDDLVGISRNCDSREAGKRSRRPSDSGQTHSETSRLDFLTIRGKT